MAAVFLVARRLGEPLGFELPSASAILKASGVSRSHAYEAAAEVVRLLQSLKRRPGRPRAQTEAARPSGDGEAVSRAVLGFVMAHPGCVSGQGTRQRYGDGFRRFLVELRDQHEAMPLEDFALSAAVPLGTLRGWLASAASPPATPTAESAALTQNQDAVLSAPLPGALNEVPSDSNPNVTAARIETVLAAYGGWCGSFRGFCEYIKRECHIHWGRDTITAVLELHGARQVQRRGGRSPDELALRRGFQTFFPGAQWVADGMSVPVTIGDETVTLNFELQCDAFSGAFVGISIRDNEDSAAVIESFREGIATTGAAPLAELLDNKPSNHTPEVDAALGNTLRIRATVRRPQNKAHVEGAFGLFSTTAPPLQLDLRPGTRQIAGQLLRLVATVWARATNHRPRRDRSGLAKSPALHHRAHPRADRSGAQSSGGASSPPRARAPDARSSPAP